CPLLSICGDVSIRITGVANPAVVHVMPFRPARSAGPISFISCHTIRSSRLKQTQQTHADRIYRAMTMNIYLIKVSAGGNKKG
ncbi:MAG: hypothetical protein RSD99_29435, partial [Janthinobacterium sp.]